MDSRGGKLIWFTLIELIISVTILAILWTIAYFSFEWYSKWARDSVRLNDMSNMKKTLELFTLSKWFYPEPTNWTDFVFSWWLVWTQWVFWDSVLTNIGQFSEKPVDPLFDTEYTYSVTSLKNEYELGWILEWYDMWYTPLINTANADTGYIALVKWTYNWKISKISTWWLDYIISLPSIISSDLSDTSVSSLILNKKLVYKNYSNLPSSYNWSIKNFKLSWGFDFDPWNIVLFSWVLSDIASEYWRINFAKNMQLSYSWTILSSEEEFQQLLSIDTENDSIWTQSFVYNILSNNLNLRDAIIWQDPMLPSLSYKNCREILDSWKSTWSGIYTIKPWSSSFDVYCDMTTDWGWWTLLFSSTQWKRFYNETEVWNTENEEYIRNLQKRKDISYISNDTLVKFWNNIIVWVWKKFPFTSSSNEKFNWIVKSGFWWAWSNLYVWWSKTNASLWGSFWVRNWTFDEHSSGYRYLHRGCVWHYIYEYNVFGGSWYKNWWCSNFNSTTRLSFFVR